MMNQVTVVIVSYFSADCLRAMAPTLQHCPNVIVVDNGSGDDSTSVTRQLIGHAQVIALEKNIGFGAANNRAFERCQTPFVLMVNPDVSFDIHTVEHLLELAQRYPEAGLLAPGIVNQKGKSATSYCWSRLLWDSSTPLAQGVVCVGFVIGAFLLARTDILKSIKGFDEEFFLYYEDEDLCQRLFDNKIPMLVDPSVTVTHASRGSVKTKSAFTAEMFRARHHTRSKFLFQEKHNPKFNTRVGTKVDNATHSLTTNQDVSVATESLPNWARRRLLLQLWLQALIALPLRLLIPSAKYSGYLGRVIGRLLGLLDITRSIK